MTSGLGRHGLVGRFLDHVATRPTAEAVRDRGGGLTYVELDERSRALAATLHARGVGAGDLVGLHLDRTCELLVAVLGVLRCGAAYVALDPSYPAARLALVAEDARLARVLSDQDGHPDFRGTEILDLRKLDSSRGAAVEDAELAPATAACVIYTSGSTGRPKGVCLTHGGIAALLEGMDEVIPILPEDTVSLFHSYAFDPSVLEMWQGLAHGARVLVVDAATARSPDDTLRLLAAEAVTVLGQTPSVFRHLVRATLAPGERLGVRSLLLGGEKLEPDALNRWWTLPGTDACLAFNVYGMTEATVISAVREVSRDELSSGDRVALIGPALRHSVIELLGPDLTPVAPGEAGELCIAGPGLSAGYVNRPELNAEKFPTLAIRGVEEVWYRTGDLGQTTIGGLRLLGRVDDQIKVRGFRIEPGEIEAALTRHAEVESAAVVTATNRLGDNLLVCHYVAAHDIGRELREHTMRLLPSHMVPARYVRHDALPMTVTGKLDRGALRRQRAA
jgi:amino acid adenylation domain-containing protein